MPLTDKGDKILAAMKEKYGDEEGERVFYASKNAGKITGVDAAARQRFRMSLAKDSAAPLASRIQAAVKDATFDYAGAARRARSFKTIVRDGVREGLPLPKILEMGVLSGSTRNSEGIDTSVSGAPPIVRDRASFMDGMRKFIKRGMTADKAITAALTRK